MASYRRILFEDDQAISDEGIWVPAPFPPPLPCPTLPPLASNDDSHGRRLVNLLLIAAAIVAAVVLLSLTYYAVLRRRRRPIGAAVVPGPGGGDDDVASIGEGEPFHHVWYIRTIGLDESTIGSIAVAEYRASDGLLDAASNCSVCLGEFNDGERVRLLPKCSHAFHVPCIDTWLRAHVNCPLCRAHIVDPDGEPSYPATAAALAPSLSASGSSVNSDSVTFAPAEGPHVGIQPLEEEQSGVPESMIDIGIPINPSEVFDTPPENSASRGQRDLGDYGLQPVRRSVSMGTPLMNAIIVRVQPEESIIDEEGKDAYVEEESIPKNRGKQGNSSKGIADSNIVRSLSSSGRGFFFSRYGRVPRIHSMPL